MFPKERAMSRQIISVKRLLKMAKNINNIKYNYKVLT